MLHTTYNDLSSMPLFSPRFIQPLPSVVAVVLVVFVGLLVVTFNASVVGCGVVFSVVTLVVLPFVSVGETPE